MPWSYVTIDKHGPVAVVRFNRKNLNAFNQQLVRELTEAARTFHDDAGADLKDGASWQLADKTDVQRRQRFYAGVRLCKAWEEMPQITIAAIERMAVGAGVAIARARRRGRSISASPARRFSSSGAAARAAARAPCASPRSVLGSHRDRRRDGRADGAARPAG